MASLASAATSTLVTSSVPSVLSFSRRWKKLKKKIPPKNQSIVRIQVWEIASTRSRWGEFSHHKNIAIKLATEQPGTSIWHPCPHPGRGGDSHLIFTSLCFPGGWGECSLSLLRPTGQGMSRGFTFDLSVVAFSCHLVIWTFNINYLHSLQPGCLDLDMLFKDWQSDLRKTGTANSTHTFVQLSTQGQGLSIFAPVSGNLTGFHTHTEWMPLQGYQSSVRSWNLCMCYAYLSAVFYLFPAFQCILLRVHRFLLAGIFTTRFPDQNIYIMVLINLIMRS